MVAPERDRGQLILIGAIAIALTVIGIALVVNAVLFTENVRPSESTAELSQASEVDFELGRSVRSLTLRVNHRSRNHSVDQIVGWVDGNVTRLSDIFGESYMSTSPTSVNVSFNPGPSINGSRLVQTGDDDLSQGGSPKWRPVRADGGDQRLGWAVLNLNITASSQDRFHANFTNPDGEYVNMTFNKTVGPRRFEVITSTSTGGSATTTCSPHYNRVLLSLHGGRSFTDDTCAFNGTNAIGNVSRVRFDGGDNVVGRYSLVAKENDFAVAAGCNPTIAPDQACVSPVVWRANVSVSIIGDGFSYTNNQDVSVYSGGS